jgi:hypothetical protein
VGSSTPRSPATAKTPSLTASLCHRLLHYALVDSSANLVLLPNQKEYICDYEILSSDQCCILEDAKSALMPLRTVSLDLHCDVCTGGERDSAVMTTLARGDRHGGIHSNQRAQQQQISGPDDGRRPAISG